MCMDPVDKDILLHEESAKSCIETAEILIRHKKNLLALYFCHNAIENSLKAAIARKTRNNAPETYNLPQLHYHSGLALTEGEKELLIELMGYQDSGKIPYYLFSGISDKKALRSYEKTVKLFNKTATKD